VPGIIIVIIIIVIVNMAETQQAATKLPYQAY